MQSFTVASMPFSPADSKTFTGTARVARLTARDESGGVRVYRVDFDRDARLHWHAHNGPQWLFVVEGCCRIQKRGEPPCDLVAGESACIHAGEEHWHGAAPGHAGAHLAVNLGTATQWGKEVGDEEYGGN
jgi:quercetin dioxygenase-like cupin family protein